MTKRNWLLVFVALALAGVYVFYFTDWFTPKIIHVSSTNARASRARRVVNNNNASFLSRLASLANAGGNDEATTIPIIFKLGRPYKLTEIKVVVLAEWQTNKNVLPLWHLVDSTNSAPITTPFTYGQNIRGMKPEVPGMRAQPLQPGVKYRLFVTDGSAKGQHDFQPTAAPPTAPGQ